MRDLSVRFVVKREKQTKAGKTPIYLKIYYRGQKVESRLPEIYDLNSKDLANWDVHNFMVKGNFEHPANSYINDIRKKYIELRRQTSNINVYSPKYVLNYLTSEASSTYATLKDYCHQYYYEFLSKRTDIANGTKKNYLKAINHFQKYLELNKLDSMYLHEFTFEKARNFMLFMMETQKNTIVSASSNLRRIKPIFEMAVREKRISENPFHGVKSKYRADGKTKCLTMFQVKQIYHLEISDQPLEYVRDVFILMVLTGQSFVDIQKMSKEELMPISKTRIKYDTTRKKTAKLVVQVLPMIAQNIIEKYSRYNSSYDRVFPKLCLETFNHKIKIIQTMAGVNFSLSSKIARTTCNQLLINVRFIDEVYKRLILGWSNKNNIADVYTTVEEDVLIGNAELIDEFFQKRIVD